jgi:restriction system protein
MYREIVSAIALRCLSECFVADALNQVAVLTFSGYVDTTDPATGNPFKPYLISIRVTKDRFTELNLDRVDTKVCLRNLGAHVSPQPAELVAVKPIIEFDMVDKRFVEEKDVLSQLDSRPNLMDLTPAEFEALVGNLFTKMGLETKLTRTIATVALMPSRSTLGQSWVAKS